MSYTLWAISCKLQLLIFIFTPCTFQPAQCTISIRLVTVIHRLRSLQWWRGGCGSGRGREDEEEAACWAAFLAFCTFFLCFFPILWSSHCLGPFSQVWHCLQYTALVHASVSSVHSSGIPWFFCVKGAQTSSNYRRQQGGQQATRSQEATRRKR